MELAVLVLEDEDEVRNSILRDLEEFQPFLRIEPAQDVDDAWAVVEEIDGDDDVLAVVLADHRMPGKSGVDFLVDMQQDERTVDARTVLLTGQADLSDTVRALNTAGLDYFLSKPWEAQELRDVLRHELTEYVLATQINPLPYMRVLESERVMGNLDNYGYGAE